jgi:hypothetical protein
MADRRRRSRPAEPEITAPATLKTCRAGDAQDLQSRRSAESEACSEVKAMLEVARTKSLKAQAKANASRKPLAARSEASSQKKA